MSGITFYIPEDTNASSANTNNILNLYFKGDTRIGRLHCATHDGQNGNYKDDINNTNAINISGDSDATLTCGNLQANSNKNNTAAIIGGTDRCDHSTTILIKDINIYAGNAYFDYGSAIGGGGNGYGIITIDGNATVTAVASSTGTAIGGGCGTSGPGGYGNVTIDSGNIYAYNYIPYQITATTKNGDVVTAHKENKAWSDAIPTAIGGGSSGAQIGGLGIVNINGGQIFAYSEVGAAIGGGGGGKGNYRQRTEAYTTTYMNATGGDANITISGGLIKAISTGTAIGAGPGGGKAYDWWTEDGNTGLPKHWESTVGTSKYDVTANGGHCELHISGGTIYTGSIGGGTPRYENGEDVNKHGFTIGAAQVYISGGSIHGQIVMEGEGSVFEMSGGVIDNKLQTETDEGYAEGYDYHFVKNSGGAVHIKTGNVRLYDGTIQNAGTRNDGDGGAIYCSGGDIEIYNGTIKNCYATNGGALYVEDGSVYMHYGMIRNNTAANNGGAVYVNGGNFTMPSGIIAENKANQMGGALFINDGNVVIGLEECKGVPNSVENHICPVLSNNTSTIHGGAFAISNGETIMYCGSIDNNDNSESPKTDSFYQNGGTFDIWGGNLSIGVWYPDGIYRDHRGKMFTISYYNREVLLGTQLGAGEINLSPIGNFENVNKENGKFFYGWSLFQDDFKNAIRTDDMFTVTNDVSVYALWLRNQYNIVYELNGGVVEGNPTTYDYTEKDVFITLNSPTRTGYIFNGWELKHTSIYQENSWMEEGVSSIINTANQYGDITLIATWTTADYTIKYENIYNVTNNPNGYNTTTATFTLEQPTRDGYTFIGWTGSNGTTKELTVTITKGSIGNKTFTAHWEANQYKTHYHGNGNTNGQTNSSSHTYGASQALTRNGYRKTGYLFSGWNTMNNGLGKWYADEEIVENLVMENNGSLTLYAQWVPISYIVVFDGNKATSGSMLSQTHIYDQQQALSKNLYNKTDHEFIGWTNSPRGEAIYADEDIVLNLSDEASSTIKLYAVWNYLGVNISGETINSRTGDRNIYKAGEHGVLRMHTEGFASKITITFHDDIGIELITMENTSPQERAMYECPFVVPLLLESGNYRISVTAENESGYVATANITITVSDDSILSEIRTRIRDK